MKQHARSINESRTGLVSLFVLVIIGISLLALLLLVSPGRAFARLSGEQAVSLHSPLFADYGVDPRILMPQINLRVVEDTIRDQTAGKKPEQEITKVVNSLKTPLPTALPYFTPTSTLTKPGVMMTNTPSTGSTEKPPTLTLPPSGTLFPYPPRQTPTGGTLAPTKTATGASKPTITLTATPWWWPTATNPVPTTGPWTPTPTLTPLPTYTGTPAPTYTATPSNTPSLTPTYTPTPTFTPTYTSTPSLTPTRTPVSYPPPGTPYP